MNNLQTQITTKIKRLRQQKGFSQLQMANLLNIEETAYSRLEKGKTYTWAKYLEELLKIFEISPDKFFEDISSNVVINNNNCATGGYTIIENLHTENREVYEKLIVAKDEEIAFYKELLRIKVV